MADIASIPSKLLKKTLEQVARLHNILLDAAGAQGRENGCGCADIPARASRRSDISDHLETLFLEGRRLRPRLMVELGVRNGESTFALERAAKVHGSWLVSVDLEPTTYSSSYNRWRFVQADDVEFAGRFPSWIASETGKDLKIDLLYIDTSHLYTHTLRELQSWLPHLSSRGTLICHDTNMRWLYRRRDGSIGAGWNNRRGVIRALETFFGFRANEREPFHVHHDGWDIVHVPQCSGLTVLRRSNAGGSF